MQLRKIYRPSKCTSICLHPNVAANNPEAYICSIMRKKQLEVNEKKLTKEEVLQFIQAKQKEVRNFVASECFEAEAARKHVDEAKWWACDGC